MARGVDPVSGPVVPVVGPDAVDELAAWCAAAVRQPLAAADLAGALFAGDEPARVRFRADVGLVATGRRGDAGFVKLLASDPASRGSGHGHRLLALAESDLEGCRTITTGADAPYFLFPGVPTTETALCCLFERHHYAREETNYNVDIDLGALPPGPRSGRVPGPGERPVVADWMTRHWPDWRAEVLRAFDRGTLVLAGDEGEPTAFCAYDVNRSGTLGPIAVRPDLIGQGVGAPLLLEALHRLRRAGHDRIEVLWVGPLVPYARVGGSVGATFFVYRRRA